MAINLLFTGDIVISSEQREKVISSEIEAILKNCDVVCCNFEAPIQTQTVKLPKIGPSLSQHEWVVDELNSSGFNLFALANNHIMDFKSEGLKNTIDILRRKGLPYIGAGTEEKFKPFVYEKEDISIGIINVAENGFGAANIDDSEYGFAWFGSHNFEEELKKAVDSYDYVIIVCHGGAEKWDFPLPEYRDLYHHWIELGADIIIGHHPHVPQGYEKYKSGYIYYSLGNFAFNKGKGIQDAKTICASLKITKDTLVASTICTEYTENGVILLQDEKFEKQIQNCCNILKDQHYNDLVDEQCLEYYRNRYKEYYSHVGNIYHGGLKQFLKTGYYRIFKRQKHSDLWLYHNLCIESHYWICRRAVSLEYRDKK